MSSFVISKKEYMKAAGIVAGMASELKIWIYDFENNRNSTKEDYKRKFEECYEMNALSVQDQYNDPEPETDDDDYKADFDEYYHLGAQLVYNDGQPLINAIHEIGAFFGSALYQTEKEEYANKMQKFFHSILVELYKTSSHYKPQSWGELIVEPPKAVYSVIGF